MDFSGWIARCTGLGVMRDPVVAPSDLVGTATAVGAHTGPALSGNTGPDSAGPFDIEHAARRLRHHTVIGFALSSVLPLLALSYLVHARVLPFLRSLDIFTTAAIAGLVAGATLAATLGGWKMLQSQACEVRGLAARLNSANAALGDANVRLQE